MDIHSNTMNEGTEHHTVGMPRHSRESVFVSKPLDWNYGQIDVNDKEMNIQYVGIDGVIVYSYTRRHENDDTINLRSNQVQDLMGNKKNDRRVSHRRTNENNTTNHHRINNTTNENIKIDEANENKLEDINNNNNNNKVTSPILQKNNNEVLPKDTKSPPPVTKKEKISLDKPMPIKFQPPSNTNTQYVTENLSSTSSSSATTVEMETGFQSDKEQSEAKDTFTSLYDVEGTITSAAGEYWYVEFATLGGFALFLVASVAVLYHGYTAPSQVRPNNGTGSIIKGSRNTVFVGGGDNSRKVRFAEVHDVEELITEIPMSIEIRYYMSLPGRR